MKLRVRVESQVFVVAIVLLAALATTWARFFFRISQENYELKASLLLSNSPAEQASKLEQVAAEHGRRTLQVAGEGSLFFALLLVCLGILFVVARDAKRAKERMDRMLAMTTHELKTPIAGVKALLQSLQLGSVPQEIQGRLLQSGVGECNRLEHLAETILAYQRAIVADSRSMENKQANELLQSIMDHRKQSAMDSKVQATLGPDCLIHVDSDALRVIVENLLDNAGKYGGPAVRVTTQQDGAHWRLLISDDGIGFAPHQANTLFEPFTRGDGVVSQHGSGLGLFIARQLAKRMGGQLTATSEGVGKGSTFCLQLNRE